MPRPRYYVDKIWDEEDNYKWAIFDHRRPTVVVAYYSTRRLARQRLKDVYNHPLYERHPND